MTNDDGFDAPGIRALIEVAREFGHVVAVAPEIIPQISPITSASAAAFFNGPFVHFIFLIKQVEEGSIKEFVKSLCASYSMDFNKRHDRIGPLFESRYKAIPIDDDEYLSHISRYIHLNPIGFRSWEYSSYNDYLYDSKTWVKTNTILGMFRTKKHYIAFVDDYSELREPTIELEGIFGDT